MYVGDVVSVEGEMDEDGFYHASFGGEKGLVPANFVQETEVTNLSTRERLFNQVSRSVALKGVLKWSTVYISEFDS